MPLRLAEQCAHGTLPTKHPDVAVDRDWQGSLKKRDTRVSRQQQQGSMEVSLLWAQMGFLLQSLHSSQCTVSTD